MDRTDIVAGWVRHEAAREVLRSLLEDLEEAGIVALPVKGVVTADLLYADPAARVLRDIDLRIRRSNLPALIRLARRKGWKPRTDSPRLQEVVLDVRGWEVDVECTIGPPGLCAIDVDDLIRRATRVTTPFERLEAELHDHALVLVLNAFKDGLCVVPWAREDLRRIVRVPSFSPSELVLRAREGRVLSALWIVSDWLAEVQGLREWGAVRERVGPRPPSARVRALFEYASSKGWPKRLGVVVAASSSDDAPRFALGLGLALLGIARRRFVVAERFLWGDG